MKETLMNRKNNELAQVMDDFVSTMTAILESHNPELHARDFGRIASISSGIITVAGLKGVQSEEVLVCPPNAYGMAFDLDMDVIGVIMLDETDTLRAGDEVNRTEKVMSVPTGDALIGRVVDARGKPLDGKQSLSGTSLMPVEQPAPEIMDRAPVDTPLQTGITVIDTLIPIGRGQRELILGDRQTGKTAIALDTIANQKGKDVICIYCGIGKRGSALAKVIAELKKRDAISYSVAVVSTEEDPPGLQFMAPYTATAMAEHFMHQGKDVLIVYDDLTRHARAYRELSLLLRRPPGREAYPGDIFYIHARLLERSTHLIADKGGGSLTALPIIETEAQNISAYIPTNLISITDGQIYLSPLFFRKGILPAVDVGKSVSRVGGKAQLPAYRTVAGDLRLTYSQFEELESFSRFGARLDEDTRKKLSRGRRIREILKQYRYSPLPAADQIAVLIALTHGVLDDIELADISDAQKNIRKAANTDHQGVMEKITAGEKIDEKAIDTLVKAAQDAVKSLKKEGADADPGTP
ncbi:alternate F1F0 ATPase, F1 subunit alpha [Desulfobacter sp.]